MNTKYKISDKMSNNHKDANTGITFEGFTLIELLIVIGVFAATGTVIVSILLATLRASNKADKLMILKQVGNPALSQVVKQIRYAKSLDIPAACPPPPGVTLSSITISSVSDNGQTTLSCDTGATPTIASNGASLLDTNAVAVSACSFTCSQPSAYSPPTINFSFKLDSKNSNNLVETTGSIQFQTSVLMRNYNK
jgi:type II secretory pathway pseudopilin PulG